MKYAIYRNTSTEEVWAYCGAVHADTAEDAIQDCARGLPDHLIERAFLAVPVDTQVFAWIHRDRQTIVTDGLRQDATIMPRRRLIEART